MKKKIMAVSLVVALLALATLGGTLAWFTAEDKVDNKFTIGSVEIVQYEKEHDAGNNLVDFTQDQPLMPIVNTADPTADESYIEKIVTVENTGKNGAYIRTSIAVPLLLKDYIHLDISDSANWGKNDTLSRTVGDYYVYIYDYKLELGTAAADKISDVLLEGVYLDSRADVKTNETSGKVEFCMPDGAGGFTFSGYEVVYEGANPTIVEVLVATQAIQADGFASYTAALENFDSATPWG